MTTKYLCIQRNGEYKVGDIVEATLSNIDEIAGFQRMNVYNTYWVRLDKLDESKIAYFDIEGEDPIRRLKERLQNNMVSVTGFDYPFSISKYKLSQEDYAVIMGVPCFFHEKEPVGAACPYLTNEWDQYIYRYSEGQHREEIDKIMKRLEELTGRRFRLPTIKEAEFINQLKSQELGFRLENELCEVGSGYLCTEEGRIYVSDPMRDDFPPYKSIRLVECEKSLGQIDYHDKDVIRAIEKRMHNIEEDMHYFWEN